MDKMTQEEFDRAYNTIKGTKEQVLEEFLKGKSDEEIAKSILLHKDTVRQYIKELCDALVFDNEEPNNIGATPPKGSKPSKRNKLFAMIAKYKPELVFEALNCVIIVLDGDLDNLTEKELNNLKSAIDKLAPKFGLKFLNIRQGSIIIEFEGSAEGFQRIKALFESGELTEIAGFPVLEVSAVSEAPTQPTQLSQWLEGIFTPLWQSVEDLLIPSQPNLAFRNRTQGVSRKKSIALDETTNIELIVTISPLEAAEIKVILEVIPSNGVTHLPDGLQVQLLDAADERIAETREAKQNIKFEITAEVGDRFSMIVEWDSFRFVEAFIV
jgi:hypothetical protein